MSSSICVILDTSVLFGDYKLEKASLRLLLNIVRLCDVSVYIPKVVFDELVYQQEESFTKAKRDLEDSLREFRNVAITDIPFDFPGSHETYSHFFESLLAQKGINIKEYPQVSHQEMVRRFYEYRKPIGKHGKKKDDAGYKDALIWETLLELLKGDSYEEILLVSSNYTDFAESESGPLHSELVDDLVKKGYSSEAVVYVGSIKEASDYLSGKFELETAPLSETIVDKITQDIDFDELLTEHLREMEDTISNNSEDIMEGEGANEAQLYWNIESSKVEIEATEFLENGEVVVHACAEFETEVEYHMFLSYYFTEETSLNQLGISLYDSDEDLDLARVGGYMVLSFNFNFVFDPSNNKISGFEALDIRRIDLSEAS